MPTYETLLSDAARLPVADRIQLIDAIWDTLPDDSLPPLSDEWVAEIQRRSAEYDAGLAETVSWDQVKAEALRRVGMAVPDASHSLRQTSARSDGSVPPVEILAMPILSLAVRRYNAVVVALIQGVAGLDL